MTNIVNIQNILNNNEQLDSKQGANIFFITSTDNQPTHVVRLSTTNTGSIIVNLNETCLTNNEKNKRSLIESEKSEPSNNNSQQGHLKRRKSDLKCVVCEGSASGFNFNQITCESCKAFFRRNALLPIENTKCLNKNKNNLTKIICIIRYDIKHKCQRCRLLKCFELGMCKDRILTIEEKFLKQQRIDENRRLCSTINEKRLDNRTTCELNNNISSNQCLILTETDWTCLHYIQNAYLSGLQSSPSASSVLSLEFPSDRMSAYMNTIDIQIFSAIKLINFLKQIQEFNQLNENDRLILVKYNLELLSTVRYAFIFDSTREISYDDTITNPIPTIEQAFALHSKSLYILCYGYEFSCLFTSILHRINNLINNDQILSQLLLLNMIFLKGLSANNDRQPSLNDNLHVFYAHSKYTDLLFRYLINKSSFEVATMKMMQITVILIKVQRAMRDLNEFLKDKVDINYVNPLMRSLFNLT